MTQEDHEVEQDAHLRRLNQRAKDAEVEVRDALMVLADCHQQKSRIIVAALAAVLTSLILAMAVGLLVYGH
jgi:hypothetical protein